MQELGTVLQNKDEIIKNLQATVKLLSTNKLIEKQNTLIEKREKLIEIINNSVYESAERKFVDNMADNINYESHEKLKSEINKLNEKIDSIIERKGKLEVYIKGLSKIKDLSWSSDLWGIFLDKMVVYKDKVVIRFKDGREVVKRI